MDAPAGRDGFRPRVFWSTSAESRIVPQVNRHERTRRDHTSETAEDYVEAVHEIEEQQGSCRNVDLARRFAVSAVTSSKIIRRLARDGLVTCQPYGPVGLTEAGRQMALESKKRHQSVVEFLRLLGVPADIAETDAEGIEHHVSDETLACIRRFIRHRRK